jgi:hypothetical protein
MGALALGAAAIAGRFVFSNDKTEALVCVSGVLEADPATEG